MAEIVFLPVQAWTITSFYLHASTVHGCDEEASSLSVDHSVVFLPSVSVTGAWTVPACGSCLTYLRLGPDCVGRS